MKNFSSLNRSKVINKLSESTYDILIIGGGITGAGIALDAQSRGLKTALIEMQDFAAGTSSRSTKLIHGGLRYLKQFEFKLVAEVGRERAIVYNNGKHVTRPEKMLLPLLKGGSIGLLAAFSGIWIYDFLARVKKKERRKTLSANETFQTEPLLKKEKITGGVLYYEYRTDDARLTIEVLKEAVKRGADVLNYLKAEEFIYENSKLVAVVCKNHDGKYIKIKAKNIVNATGPWLDTLDKLDNAYQNEKLILTKGVHIVIDGRKLPLEQSVYFDVPDGRMVFAIPREGKIYIGTTDTFYRGDIKDPVITLEDKEYLIQAVNQIFILKKSITVSDIESGWAGLRPLIKQEGKSASSISRKDEIFQYPSGLISIAGGKLTGYRKMAQRIVDIVSNRLQNQKEIKECTTQTMKISGGYFDSESDYKIKTKEYYERFLKYRFSPLEAQFISAKYGSNCNVLLLLLEDHFKKKSDFLLPLSIQLQIYYCIHYENTLTLSDFCIRRTGLVYFDIALVKEWRNQMADYMGTLLEWDLKEKSKNLEELNFNINIASGLI